MVLRAGTEMGRLRYAGIANLYERDGVFYFRYQLPSKQRTLLGCREFRKSLKTRDPFEARLRCVVAGSFMNSIMQELDAMMTLNVEVVPDLACNYLRQRLDHLMTFAEVGPSDPNFFSCKDERSAALREWESHKSQALMRDPKTARLEVGPTPANVLSASIFN
jgi:hypothetical protein